MNEKDVERLRERLKPLKGALGRAFRPATLAVDYAISDPEGSVGKARLVIEALLKDLHRRHLGKPAPRDAPIEQLKGRVHDHLPDPVRRHIATVQQSGNAGVHDRDEPMEAPDAEPALVALVRVCEWYAEAYPAPRTRSGLPWRRMFLGAVASGAVATLGFVAFLVWALSGQGTQTVTTSTTPPEPVEVASATVTPVQVVGAGTAPAVVVDGSAAVQDNAVVGAADAQPLEEVLPGLPDFDRVVVARGGLTMSRNPAYKAKRLRKKDPQADAEVCRLAEGAPVERLDAERGYVRLKAWCGGAVQEGWALEKIDRAATLETASEERVLVALGDAALAEEQPEIAKAAFAAALKEAPGNVDAIAGLARADQIRALAEERRRGLVREMAIGP